MSNILKLTLKSKSGVLTELQSDTIFGHFCWRLRELSGESTLIEFLKYFIDNNPIFTISNSLYEIENEIYFPVPTINSNVINKSDSTKNDKIFNFLKFKNNKSNGFISTKNLNEVINGNKELNTIAIPDKYKSEEDLRTSTSIDRTTLKAKESSLWSVAPVYYRSKLVLLIKVINNELFNEYKCEEILKSVFELGFGKKKSSGFGSFEVIGNLEKYNEINEPNDYNGFYSLSNYFPNQTDGLDSGTYRLQIKYPKTGEEYSIGGNPFKKPFLFIKPGAVFLTNANKEFYGSVLKNLSFKFPHIIQNCIAFTIKIKV